MMFYRWRQALHQKYFRWRTRRILDTPPLPCDPAGNCSIHTMLSKRDMPMYLPAVKSLLRFCPSAAVMVHSDGSLDGDSVQLVQHHVPGARVILANEADERARQALGSDSYLFRWRSHDASWRRLVDTELWCTAPKRIILDSDVIVLRRPEEVIAWIEHGKGALLFGQPPAEAALNSADPKLVQTVFRQKLSQVAQRVGLPARFPQGATAGFCGCECELPLDRVEHVLRGCEAEGLPMKQWGADQCVVIYLLEASGAARLSPRHYINYDPGCDGLVGEAHILHFYGTYRYRRHLYTRLAARVASELLAAR
jgi:hypothetical protein